MTYVERDQGLVGLRRGFTEAVMQKLGEGGASISYMSQRKLIRVNDTVTVRALVARYRLREGCWGWLFRLQSPTNADYTVIARLAPENRDFLDY